jgi:hypothetical protein
VAGLDDQAQIRREGTVVGESGSLLVLVRGRKVVGKLSGAQLDITLLIGLAGVLVRLGELLGLIDSEDGTNEASVRDSLERVARGTDFLVDLETTAEARMKVNKLAAIGSEELKGGSLRLVIVGLEPLLVNPGVLGGVKTRGRR